MQTEVPTLPVVHFNAHKNLNRKQNSNLGRPSVETKANSPHKNITCLSSKKKVLHPLLGRPYQSNARQFSTTEQSKLNRNTLEQRVLSAKMLRIKELQNQLADAHYRLNELATENKLLKALQKRQDSALKRYEGTNAELPRIINSHHEELRVLQIKYKKLKALQKETCDLLKEKENELQHLQTQNKHLLQLSKDRNLGEREKLQLQVSDLNHRMQQQQETIQTLHRKMALEAKSLKQQLQIEISKRKEAQKHLLETTEKLRILENYLDNKERRLYYNGQLLFPDKSRRFGTQSLTNLRDISSSNPLKMSEKNKKWHTDVPESNVSLLHNSELNSKDIKGDEEINSNQTLDTVKTETMANLEQVRKYRLQKSPNKKVFLLDTEENSKELVCIMDKNSEISMDLENSEQLETRQDAQKYDVSADKFRRIYKNRRHENFHELSRNELTYSSGGSDSENEESKDYTSAATNSKQLHARLTSSADDTSDSKELPFHNCKYTNKLKVLIRERKNSYESDTEIGSEMRKQSIQHYLVINHEDDAFKLNSSMPDKSNHYQSDQEDEKFTSSPKNILDESENCQNFSDDAHSLTKSIENKNMQAQFGIKKIQVEYTSKEDPENYVLQDSVSKEQGYNQISIIDDDAENMLLLRSGFRRENSISFRTSNNVESENEIVFNNPRKNSMKYSLHSSENLDEEEVRNRIDSTEMAKTDKDIFFRNRDLETKNKLNKEESGNVLSDNDSTHTFADVSASNENSAKARITNYNKEKLLASMKAIDDNENIEFPTQDYGKQRATSKRQIAENIFLDLPTHMRTKQDIIKDIFDTDVTKHESTGSCNKLH